MRIVQAGDHLTVQAGGHLYVLNRAHGLRGFKVSSVPGLRWHNFFRLLIENTQQMKTITDFPLLSSDLLQSNRLVYQDFRDKNVIAVPLSQGIGKLLLANPRYNVNHVPGLFCK
jgi:hypothetical protein